MAVETGYSKIVTSGSVFIYDTGDVFNSYLGEPTTNLVPSPYAYSLYAYASGPVDTTVLNETGNTITAKRYTVTNAVNTARAAIFPVTTTNTNYTFSFKWKYNGSTTATPSFTVSAAKGNPETANNSFNSQSTTTTAIGNGWYLTVYTFNFSSNPTSGCILTFGLDTGATASYVGETYDIYQAQFELKDHKTQYVLGTRSVSGSLLDVSGIGNSVNVANMSFNSNAQMVFDGTDDYINASTTLGANCTLEIVIQSSNYNVKIPISLDGDNYGSGPNIFFYAGVISWNTGDSAGNPFSNSSYPNSNYHHIVVTNTSGVSAILYIDGVQIGTANPLNATTTGANKLWIGRFHGDNNYTIAGKIPIAKVYNRALSASEVLTNFNHYKTRFNIT